MKLVIVAALALVACAAARAAPAAPAVPTALVAAAVSAEKVKDTPQIVKSNFEQDPSGKYDFAFETEDGITRQENGEVKSLPNEKNEPVEVVVVRGSYSYTDLEGLKHTVNYVADETGFHTDIDPKA